MRVSETDNSFIVEGDVECNSCGGTGLYVGFAERDGAAIVCINCGGDGFIPYKETFKKFFDRKLRKAVRRVYTHSAHGFVTSALDGERSDNGMIPFSKRGCSYEDWRKGVKQTPIYELSCPYQHTNQELQSNDKNNLYKTRCNKNLGFGMISNCKLRHDMKRCWEIFEAAK